MRNAISFLDNGTVPVTTPFEGGLHGLTKARTEILTSLSGTHDRGNHDEIIAMKQLILEDLYKDNDLFVVLNNPELKNHPPEDYRNINIFSYMQIPKTQSNVKNFICFEVNDRETLERNNILIARQIVFRTVSHESDVETIWGVDRQDLLAMIIKDRFNWSNCLGLQLKKSYDMGKIAENGYYYRDIYYDVLVPNGLYKGTTNNRLDRNTVNNQNRGVYDARRFD